MDVRLVPPPRSGAAAPTSPGAPTDDGPTDDEPVNGLAMLPFVTYFMRAPLPYPFVEEFTESVTDGGRGGSSFRSRRYHTPADAHPSGGGSPPVGGGRRASQSSRGGGAAAAAPPPPMAPPPSAPIYRNVLTHEKETQHPLRHVYARLAKRQAKLIFQRKKPDAMSPEAWMEFVGSGGAPYYYCFVMVGWSTTSPRSSLSVPSALPSRMLRSATPTGCACG